MGMHGEDLMATQDGNAPDRVETLSKVRGSMRNYRAARHDTGSAARLECSGRRDGHLRGTRMVALRRVSESAGFHRPAMRLTLQTSTSTVRAHGRAG